MKTDRSYAPFAICLLQWGTHRGAQGRLIRRALLIVFLLFVSVVCQKFFVVISEYFGFLVAIATSSLVAFVGGWVAVRLLQYPPIVDFLVDVQTESSKVSWSTWPELRRTTVIVLAAMIAFSAYLFVCDMSWQFVLRSLSILNV
ncbi:MAG: preprotein translocase subunit SecE [Planctomycetota bacterium]